MGRYDSRIKTINKDELYSDIFEERGVNHIRQYTTPTLRHPTAKERESVERIRYVWTSTSKLWRLAEEHYGEPGFWFIISWWNQKPTEAHFKPGDIVFIPVPLERVLNLLKI